MPRRRKDPRLLYTGIRVRDIARSLRFYRSLGFRERFRGKMEHGGIFVQLVYPGQAHRLELNYYPRSNPYYEPLHAGTELDHIGFYATDLEAWLRLLRRRRIPLVLDFTEGTQRVVYVRDPDNVWLEFFGTVRRRPGHRRRAPTRIATAPRKRRSRT